MKRYGMGDGFGRPAKYAREGGVTEFQYRAAGEPRREARLVSDDNAYLVLPGAVVFKVFLSIIGKNEETLTGREKDLVVGLEMRLEGGRKLDWGLDSELDQVLPFGKYKNKTYREVSEDDLDYVLFLTEKCTLLRSNRSILGSLRRVLEVSNYFGRRSGGVEYESGALYRLKNVADAVMTTWEAVYGYKLSEADVEALIREMFKVRALRAGKFNDQATFWGGKYKDMKIVDVASQDLQYIGAILRLPNYYVLSMDRWVTLHVCYTQAVRQFHEGKE